MTATDELLQHNQAYSGRFTDGELPGPPAMKVAVVTCMDCRLDPAAALGLRLGDAHVIRNAGGVVSDDVIRSLSISQHHLGTEEVVVVHHTKCGMMTFGDEEFAQQLEQETGQRPEWSAGTFADLEQDVRDGLRRILESPFVPRKEAVRGYVYDVDSGRVSEVAADA